MAPATTSTPTTSSPAAASRPGRHLRRPPAPRAVRLVTALGAALALLAPLALTGSTPAAAADAAGRTVVQAISGTSAAPSTLDPSSAAYVRTSAVAVTTSTVGGSISRSEALSRGKYWTDLNVPYSQTSYAPDLFGRLYRTDCSGFVSMAWHLSTSRTTSTLPEVSHRITKAQLLPGDVLLRSKADSPNGVGHVIMFRGWADAAHTKYYASEETGAHGAIARVLPYPYFSGYGLFLPYRYDRITG